MDGKNKIRGDMMIDREMKTTINNWILQGKEAFLLTGARQIGKTYLIRECLKESKYDYIALNFIERPELVELFENATNAQDLLMRLSLITDKQLNKGNTIIFFDEIQEFKDIVTRIKFLVEEGSYRYIMSGSLLGVELNDLRSAPVGYLRIEDMYPLTVKEFMKAVGIKENILEMLEECYKKQQPVDEFVHKKMLDVFYLYLIVGGMPEAVAVYTQTNDLARVAAVHQKIMRLYKADFTKYETNYKLKLREIYDSMPGQLDSKNKRFKINTLGKGLNYDRVANDFLWLKDAGVAIPVYNINEPKLPLIISENRNLFKLFFSDVGILTNQYSDQVKIAILNKRKINQQRSPLRKCSSTRTISKRIQFILLQQQKTRRIRLRHRTRWKSNSTRNKIRKRLQKTQCLSKRIKRQKLRDRKSIHLLRRKCRNKRTEDLYANLHDHVSKEHRIKKHNL